DAESTPNPRKLHASHLPRAHVDSYIPPVRSNVTRTQQQGGAMMRPRSKGFAGVSQESAVALRLAMANLARPRWLALGGLLAVSVALGGIAQAQSTCDAGVTKAVEKKVSCKLKVL